MERVARRKEYMQPVSAMWQAMKKLDECEMYTLGSFINIYNLCNIIIYYIYVIICAIYIYTYLFICRMCGYLWGDNS
jgi:hypothetical protein